MLLINLSHPLTPEQRIQVETLTGQSITRELERMPQFDNDQPFADQIVALVDELALTSRQWQTDGIVLNPPGYAPAAAVLVAELHGRSGHFPAILRLRPVPGSVPTRFEVAELIDLQTVRAVARTQRETAA